jgi:hypothetical protein
MLKRTEVQNIERLILKLGVYSRSGCYDKFAQMDSRELEGRENLIC